MRKVVALWIRTLVSSSYCGNADGRSTNFQKSAVWHSPPSVIFRRNTVPSIATLETICREFGITMSQFFADTDMVELTPDMKELFDCWVCLTLSQKSAAIQMLKAMSHDNE